MFHSEFTEISMSTKCPEEDRIAHTIEIIEWNHAAIMVPIFITGVVLLIFESFLTWWFFNIPVFITAWFLIVI